MIKKYNEFITPTKILENVQAAKNYLKNLELSKIKKGSEEKTTPQQLEQATKLANNNPDFKKIRDLLKDNVGYTYAFTKFFFTDGAPFEELASIYKLMLDNKQFLGQLPMNIDSYGNVVPDSSDNRKGVERILDDLENLSKGRVAKKWIDNLYGPIRTEYAKAVSAGDEASEKIVARVTGIATAFDEFGKSLDGVKDDRTNKELQKIFFNKAKRYKTLKEAIQGGEAYVKAASNGKSNEFLKSIAKVNSKYGDFSGAEIAYDENDFIIVELKSFQACNELCSNTSWCIASSSYQWDNYVGTDSEEKFRKQYAIFNFNLAPSDPNSAIGVTIDYNNGKPEGTIYACHNKPDRAFKNELPQYLSKYDIPFTVLAPMSKEEMSTKKKRIQANKEIVKKNISLEQLKQYLEDGANPNAQKAEAMFNAVAENNIEKVKYLYSKGGSLSIVDGKGEIPIYYASSFDMFKVLVGFDSTLPANLIQSDSVITSYELVKYLLDNGYDAASKESYSLRAACRFGNNIDIVKLLVERGANIGERRFITIAWTAESANVAFLEYFMTEYVNQVKNGKIRNQADIANNSELFDYDQAKWKKSVIANKIMPNIKKNVPGITVAEKEAIWDQIHKKLVKMDLFVN